MTGAVPHAVSEPRAAGRPGKSIVPSGEARHVAIQAACLCLTLLPASLAALALDTRLLDGVSVWSKPLKFEASLALHFLTIAVLAGLLAPATRASRWLRWPVLAGSVAAVLEILYIVLQAARGHRSHFNLETPAEIALYGAMGIGALLIILASGMLGLLIWRQGRPEAGVGLWLGAALGLVGGSLLTLILAGALSAHGGHWVGGVHSDAAGLPLTGWSTTGGDLRVAHFLATHVMQVVPAAGWLADRLVPARAGTVAGVTFAVLLALALLTFVQALLGMPLVPA